MKRVFVVLILLVFNFSLTGQTPAIVTGKVIDTVRCQANEKISYALYLPKKYSRGTAWPVIFFYDPAARGSLPVRLYSSLAEKYQCILVGSNTSRNGPFAVSQEAEQAILTDVKSRLSLAADKFFISGFSGGARASVFLSLRRRIYAGIIACGAAFPLSDKLTAKDNIPFIEIIGNQDMNFSEAVETEDYLKKINYPHALLFFQGSHTWPPADVYDQALFWQLFRLQPPTKSLMLSYDSSVLTKAKQEIASGDVLLAYWNLNNATSLSPRIDSLRKSLATNTTLSRQQKSFGRVMETERDLLRQFYKGFEKFKYASHDSAFKEAEWKSMLASVKKYGKSENVLEVQMSERVLQQVTIGCYESSRQHMEHRLYLQAMLAAKVLVLLQPDYNSYLMLARSYAKMDRGKEAVNALAKSAELGLSDKSIATQRDFSKLASEKKFSAVVQQIELNSKKPR